MRKLFFIMLIASVFCTNSFSQDMLQGEKTWYTVSKILLPPYTSRLTDARFETIIKVFKALNAKINFNIELLDQKASLV